MINEYRYFLVSNFAGVNRLFFYIIQMKISIIKYLKLEDIFYQMA